MGTMIAILIYLCFLGIIGGVLPCMLHFREAAKYRRMCKELQQAKLLLIARGKTGRRR